LARPAAPRAAVARGEVSAAARTRRSAPAPGGAPAACLAPTAPAAAGVPAGALAVRLWCLAPGGGDARGPRARALRRRARRVTRGAARGVGPSLSRPGAAKGLPPTAKSCKGLQELQRAPRAAAPRSPFRGGGVTRPWAACPRGRPRPAAGARRWRRAARRCWSQSRRARARWRRRARRRRTCCAGSAGAALTAAG
jgi:hypothetical protein